MNKYCMYRHKNNVSIEGNYRKAEHIQRNKSKCSCDKNIYKMHAAPGKPVHVYCGMMNGMEPPQIVMCMKKTVYPILKKIGYKKCNK